MHREDKFAVSRKPYAVDLSSLRTRRNEGQVGPFWYCTVQAVWFRRRRIGRTGALTTVACIGALWAYQRPEPGDAEAFLSAHTDGRHGGACAGRWDGSGYWGSSEDPDVMAGHLQVLKPMLTNYPQIPAGYDGWWRF